MSMTFQLQQKKCGKIVSGTVYFVLCFKTKNTLTYKCGKKISEAQEGSEMTIRSSSELPP